MDVLCTDKTGTLTENQIALVRHLDTEGNDSENVLLYSYINSSLRYRAKSPLDDAIVRFRHIDIDRYRKIDEIPFDFMRKRISVVVSERPGQRRSSQRVHRRRSSGSVRPKTERRQILPLTMRHGNRIDGIYQAQSADGFRTLAVCYRQVAGDQTRFSVDDEKEMILVGLITFIDPPKESARESIRLLEDSGIELKILTGDNELVTQKTCELIGLEVKGVLTGAEIETHGRRDPLPGGRERDDLFPHDPGAEEPGHECP